MRVNSLRMKVFKSSFFLLLLLEEALHALDRYRLFGRELEVEFARGDRKSTSKIRIEKWFEHFFFVFSAPSEMRAREKESRYGRGGGGGDSGRRDRSRR